MTKHIPMGHGSATDSERWKEDRKPLNGITYAAQINSSIETDFSRFEAPRAL